MKKVISEKKDLGEFGEVQEIAEGVTKETVALVANPQSYYNHYALNFIIGAAISEYPQARLIPLGENQNLAVNLQQFRDTAQTQAVIPIRPIDNEGQQIREHFAGIHIQRDEDGHYHASYIDPTGLGTSDNIPANIRIALAEILGIQQDEITSTTNVIQDYILHAVEGSEDMAIEITNVHCGAFIGHILSQLVRGGLRVEGDRIEQFVNGGWEDCEDMSEDESRDLGENIRKSDLELLTGRQENLPKSVADGKLTSDFLQGLEDITGGIEGLAKAVATADDKEHYKLKRSDSDMSQYSDLVDEMLTDQMGTVSMAHQREYDIVDAIERNPLIEKIDEEIKQLRTDNYSLRARSSARAKNNVITKEESKRQQDANKHKSSGLETRKKALPEEQEIDYTDIADRRTHLFRGKDMNTEILDPSTGLRRVRTKKEIEEYVTRKYAGAPIYSDGVAPVRHDLERTKAVETTTRGYIKGIKDGVEKKSLFGSGTSYSKATGHLMQITGLRGSPVVATSKFPWVGPEYMAGQMGGSAGGGRNTEFGYQKDGKPVNRVMGNGFAMSLSLADYKALRDSHDLIDVNLDIVGETTTPNRTIEEVTFVSKVDGKYVKGSLPMVLPRLDRDWAGMPREKHAQYLRVFGIDKHKYKEFQDLLKTDGNYPLGRLTDHLIQHHGNLLRDMVITADRKDGYEGKFVATRNPTEVEGRPKCGDLTDLNNGGSKLAKRDARKGSSGKESPYLVRERREVIVDEKDQDLSERLKSSAQTPLASSKKSGTSTSEVVVATPMADAKHPNIARTLFKLSATKKQEVKKSDILDMPSLSEALQEVAQENLKPSTVVSSPSSSRTSSRSSSRSNSVSD